jgi:hypothetical protein
MDLVITPTFDQLAEEIPASDFDDLLFSLQANFIATR